MSKRRDSMKFITGLRTLAACLTFGIVAACGGGGSGGGGGGTGESGNSATKGVTGPGTISGVAHDGPISGATINVYAWNGQRGQLLASTVTDTAGRYSVRLTVAAQPVL